MFICWSAKGGSGTTVVSAALALVLSHRRPAVLVDLAGDAAAALGLAEPAGPGVADWLVSPAADSAALQRLLVPASDTLQLLPLGSGPAHDMQPGQERWRLLAHALSTHSSLVVIDAGTGRPPTELMAAAEQRLLVTRPCYLALRRAVAAGLQPTGIVVVAEPGRALGARDIERSIGAPVLAEVAYDPAVARSVDAGLLASRLPRSLARSIERAA